MDGAAKANSDQADRQEHVGVRTSIRMLDETIEAE